MTSLAEIMHTLGQGSSQPLYQRLQRALRMAIDQRAFGPDEALPAERQLAAELSISRITVRKAIDGLVDEGLLVRRPGSGNFINTRIEKNFAKLTSFSEDMRAHRAVVRVLQRLVHRHLHRLERGQTRRDDGGVFDAHRYVIGVADTVKPVHRRARTKP